MDDYYFDGDPEVDSTRRQLERVLQGRPPRRRWPWLVAAIAGGTAFGIWRIRSRRSKPTAPAEAEQGAMQPASDRQHA